jgi:hypothetical protein
MTSPSAFHALAQYCGLSEIGLGVSLCGVTCLVIVLWMRFLRYWADQEVKAQAERREELHRALALTHDLSKRGAKGWQR